jgi:hypothetical protein
LRAICANTSAGPLRTLTARRQRKVA